MRFTSRTWRQTDGSVSRGPATIGEIPALQIHTSTPPHSATVASATASLKSSSVTSPLSTRDGPGSASATAFRSFSVRATSATDAPATENAWASSAPSPRLAPVITTRLPVTAPGSGNDAGISIWSVIALSGSSLLYRPVQYTPVTSGRPRPACVLRARPRRDAPPDAADPRVRGAGARRSTAAARSPASCTSRSDRRRRRWAPAGRCIPTTSSPRPIAATATAWPRASTRSGCSPS